MMTAQRTEIERKFRLAWDNYIAAIKAHADAHLAAIQTEDQTINDQYLDAEKDVETKRAAYYIFVAQLRETR